MEYINKVNEEAANAYIDPYLQQAKADNLSVKDIYNHLGSYDVYGTRCGRAVKTILLNEQNGRCCYCMKRIGNDATIEHIIPQSLRDSTAMQHYFSSRAPYLSPHNICDTDSFVNSGYPAAPPYPHKVSYHNFVAACRKCNDNRDNNIIEPLFLYPGIKEEVKYDDVSGEMSWDADPVYKDIQSIRHPTIEILKLNAPNLKLTRALCFYFKKESRTFSSCTKEERNCILYDMLGEALEHEDSPDITSYINMSTDFFWNKLSEFEYFMS